MSAGLFNIIVQGFCLHCCSPTLSNFSQYSRNLKWLQSPYTFIWFSSMLVWKVQIAQKTSTVTQLVSLYSVRVWNMLSWTNRYYIKANYCAIKRVSFFTIETQQKICPFFIAAKIHWKSWTLFHSMASDRIACSCKPVSGVRVLLDYSCEQYRFSNQEI